VVREVRGYFEIGIADGEYAFLARTVIITEAVPKLQF
jgi:hypothetical protein